MYMGAGSRTKKERESQRESKETDGGREREGRRNWSKGRAGERALRAEGKERAIL